MIRAQTAIRLGVRAATRNPELAFAKALLDLGGTALTLLPVFFAVVCAYIVAARTDLATGVLQAFAALRATALSTAGAVGCAVLLSWVLGSAFWSGALPLLAADAELSRRPPAGNFFLLASRGFSRVIAASAFASLLFVLVRLAIFLAFAASAAGCILRPTFGRFAALALLLCVAIAAEVLLGLLGDLWIVRAAALGDGASAAFGRAASLLGHRLSACLLVFAEFALFDLVVALVAGGIGAALFSSANLVLDPASVPFSIPARIAVSIAFGAVFGWLEVARKGSLAAIAADEEGLIEGPATPPAGSPPIEPAVVEALPVADEPVVEALLAPPEEVVEALPWDEKNDPEKKD